VLAVGILLAHFAVIIIVASSASVHTRIAEAPLVVSMIAPAVREPQELRLPKPTIALPRPLWVPVPEVQSTEQTDIASSTASSSGAGPHSQEAATPAGAPSRHLQIMSKVDYVQRPVPIYPRESRLAHEDGLVVLRVLIDESGHARDIDVYKSSGHPRLDREAIAAVARASFKPYVDGGVAKAAIAMVPIEFSLRGRSS
jgi:protein TonB